MGGGKGTRIYAPSVLVAPLSGAWQGIVDPRSKVARDR